MYLLFLFLSGLFISSGLVFLKLDKYDSITSCCFFSIAMGLTGLIILLFKYFKNSKIDTCKYSFIGGILYFFANLFLIMAIKIGPSLPIVRILLFSFETVLLFILSYLIFNNKKISLKLFLGITLVIFGICLITLK